MSFALNHQQNAQFQRDGYLVVEHLFDSEEIELLGKIARADRELASEAGGRRNGGRQRKGTKKATDGGKHTRDRVIVRRITKPSYGTFALAGRPNHLIILVRQFQQLRQFRRTAEQGGMAAKSFGEPDRIAPRRSTLRPGSARFDYRFPALSLTVIKWAAKKG